MGGLKTKTNEKIPKRSENDWEEYSKIALSNELSDESAEMVTSQINKQTSELFIDLLNIYVEIEIHIINIKALWKNIFLKAPKKDRLKIRANQKKMINSLNGMHEQLELLLRVVFGSDFDIVEHKIKEFKKIRDDYKKIDKSTENRDIILNTIFRKLQDLNVYIPENTDDVSNNIKAIIATEKINWRIPLEKQPLDNEKAIQCLNIINQNKFWRKIKSTLLVEIVFSNMMNGILAAQKNQEHKNDYLFISNTLQRITFNKDAADNMSHLSKQQRQSYEQSINFFTKFIRTTQKRLESLAFIQHSKKDSSQITATAKDSISANKWKEISSNLIDNLGDDKRYEVAEETDKKLSVKDHNTKSNIEFNKYDRSIQAVLPATWFDTKLDNKQRALIKTFLEQVRTLPEGTVVRIGNCSKQPKVAIILDKLVRESGLKARYDEKDGTKAAVDSLPPASSLRTAQGRLRRVTNVSKKRTRKGP